MRELDKFCLMNDDIMKESATVEQDSCHWPHQVAPTTVCYSYREMTLGEPALYNLQCYWSHGYCSSPLLHLISFAKTPSQQPRAHKTWLLIWQYQICLVNALVCVTE